MTWLDDTAAAAKGWWAENKNTVMSVGVSLGVGLVTAAVVVATGGAAAPLAVAAIAGVTGSVAGHVTGELLEDRPVTAGGVIKAAVVGGVIGVATAGVGARLAPLVGKAFAPAAVRLGVSQGTQKVIATAVSDGAIGAVIGGSAQVADNVAKNHANGRPLTEDLGRKVGRAILVGGAVGTGSSLGAQAVAPHVQRAVNAVVQGDRPIALPVLRRSDEPIPLPVVRARDRGASELVAGAADPDGLPLPAAPRSLAPAHEVGPAPETVAEAPSPADVATPEARGPPVEAESVGLKGALEGKVGKLPPPRLPAAGLEQPTAAELAAYRKVHPEARDDSEFLAAWFDQRDPNTACLLAGEQKSAEHFGMVANKDNMVDHVRFERGSDKCVPVEVKNQGEPKIVGKSIKKGNSALRKFHAIAEKLGAEARKKIDHFEVVGPEDMQFEPNVRVDRDGVLERFDSATNRYRKELVAGIEVKVRRAPLGAKAGGEHK